MTLTKNLNTMPAQNATSENLFSELLRFYGITNFESQILKYGETFKADIAAKWMPDAEFELSLKEGFYFGHETAGLGEILSFSAVPRFIKKFYPGARVLIGPNRFSEAVFRSNPHVDSIGVVKGRTLYGSQREFGMGTTTQRRLFPVGITAVRPEGPEMFISPPLMERAREWKASLPLNGRKLILVQSSGRTNPKMFSFFRWLRMLRSVRDEFYFVQIGNLRDQFIWAEKVLLKQWNLEEMAAYLSLGDAFMGPNSGVMHLASAVRVPSVILHNEALASEMKFPILGDNWKLPAHVNHHLFHAYPWHHHLVLEKLCDVNDAWSSSTAVENVHATLRAACLGPNPVWLALKDRFAVEPVSVRI